jgi:hypothetical protein
MEFAMIWMSVAFLALSGADPGGAGPWQMSTPPELPGMECGPSWPRRELRDLPLTPETTYDEVVRAWGEPRPEGPAGEVSLYYLNCTSYLWLSFEPSGRRRLMRALLFREYHERLALIFDNMEITRRRRCSQLGRRSRQRGRSIAYAWGPPDNQSGSGLVRWTYDMADGGFAQVFPESSGLFTVACRPGRR